MDKNELVKGLYAFDTVEQVKEKGYTPHRWREIGGTLGKGFPRPVISVTVRILDEELFGQAGVLTLTFFVDRLQKVGFIPDDAVSFALVFAQRYRALKVGESLDVPPFTMILRCRLTEGPYQDQQIFEWSDKRLDEEEREWRRKNK